MRIAVALFLTAIAMLPLLLGCESAAERVAREAAERVESEKTERRNKRLEAAEKEAAELPALIEPAKAAYKKLRSSFNHEKDEFKKDREWYRHKTFSEYTNTNGTTIKGEVSKRGNIRGYSAYVGEDWIFHDRFIVKIGDTMLSTRRETKRDVIRGSGQVVETVDPDDEIYERRTRDGYQNMNDIDNLLDSLNKSYPGLIEMGDIFRFIANNPNETVRVRLEGERNKDYTLRKDHQKAICETVEFADALKILDRAKIDSKSIQ